MPDGSVLDAAGVPLEALWPAKRRYSQDTLALNCLLRNDFFTAGDVLARTRDDLLSLPGFGCVCLAVLEEALAAHGAALADT